MRWGIRVLAILVFSSLVWAQPVPWVSSEKLVYQLLWQGMSVGRLYISADPAESGWRYRLKLEPEGLAALGGYGLEAESQVDSDFFTEHFWKNLTEPFKGTTKLVFQRNDGSGTAKVLYPDGHQSSWQTPAPQVLDDLSLIFYLRLKPEPRTVSAIDYPKLAQGKLEALGKNSEGSQGFRFVRDDLLVEVWYRSDPRRTPVKVIFGRDFGRLEANLIDSK